MEEQVNKNVSEPITLNLVIEDANDVASAPLTIQFDPKILKLNDAVRGTFWSSDGQEPTFTKNIQNDTGTATIQIARKPGVPGVSGVGTLVSLNFQGVAKGSAIVTVPNLTLSNSKGQAVGTASPHVTVNVK